MARRRFKECGEPTVFTPPELLGLNALGAFAGHDSCSRAQMFGSHFSQHLVIEHPDEKRVQTGLEQAIGKFTFAVRMPVDGVIIALIDRYPAGVSVDAIPQSPETVVIYEDVETKELGCFSIPEYASYHQYFGFKYKKTDAMNRLSKGEFFAKGTVFADSPAISEYGGYQYGVNLNTVLMSHPGVAEDGVIISKSALKKLAFRVYETRTIEFGNGTVPLNMYGTPSVYKPFPEIGEYIREDGILMMLRQVDPLFAPVQMSVHDTLVPNPIFDKGVYVRGPGGKVVDIKVYHDDELPSSTPSLMMDTMGKYHRNLTRFHTNLLNTRTAIAGERKRKTGNNAIETTPELHRLLVKSLAMASDDSRKVTKLYRKNPLSDYRVVITLEYIITPTYGYKITDCHGKSN